MQILSRNSTPWRMAFSSPTHKWQILVLAVLDNYNDFWDVMTLPMVQRGPLNYCCFQSKLSCFVLVTLSRGMKTSKDKFKQINGNKEGSKVPVLEIRGMWHITLIIAHWFRSKTGINGRRKLIGQSSLHNSSFLLGCEFISSDSDNCGRPGQLWGRFTTRFNSI